MTMDVSVELAHADASASQARVLLEACSIAVHPARCFLASEGKAAGEGTAIATLRWAENHTVARIEVGFRIHGVDVRHKRNVSFLPSDPGDERWRTVGYAVATLVDETAPREQVEPAGEVAAPKPAAVQNPNPAGQDSREDKSARFWIDGQFVLSAGVPGLAPTPGGELRFSSIVFGRRVFVYGALQGTFHRWTLDDVSVLQASASWGGGFVMLRLPHFDLAVRADAFLHLIEATGVDSGAGTARGPATEMEGRGHRWGVGFTEEVDGAWMWTYHIGLVAGVGVSEMTAATELTGHGQRLENLPAARLDFKAGLRWAFP